MKELDDGRPMNTDVFLVKAMEKWDDKWDFWEAVNQWIEGDWDAACEGLDET